MGRSWRNVFFGSGMFGRALIYTCQSVGNILLPAASTKCEVRSKLKGARSISSPSSVMSFSFLSGRPSDVTVFSHYD